MMVPRSYPFLHQPAPSPDRRQSKKMGARPARTVPATSNSARPQPAEKQETMCNIAVPKPVTPTPPVHSKPVVIPPRTPIRTLTSTQTQTVRARGQNGGRSQRVPANHKSDAIPPAVAALLAVTEIPPMPKRRRNWSTMDRSISMDELIKEWKQDDTDLASSVTGSPLDLLLGRVDEYEEDCVSLRSLEQEKDFLTCRSISSDSIASTIPPSLEPDAPSITSTWDNLTTPDSFGRRLPDRRERIVQSPPKEECILDHPLLHFDPDECEELANLEIPDIGTPSPTSTDRFKSFKSNLTASLQALKSAAKSFSNFTAPSVPPDDLLTRSLLSPKFTSEMRPKQLQGIPSPALRRYLNPQSTLMAPISPTELSMQLHDAFILDENIDTTAPMIQMQTYDRRGRSSSRKRRGSDQFSEAGRTISPSPAVRQREPRENSDFLRVIVLEMNMRRVGKLDAKAVGKARIWLPPRKTGSSKVPSIHGGVPGRWTAISADEEL
ncbi:uncharacterized protein BDR25DRAFT_79416 [Lindgomyces ingoldianus]|uniref:Uncharacterized protein n=1 Tax=Lindgomyces ingoldianus TaxID=673940 RepID=A0ACB6QJ09_9PLEO|nr:uncharacterized protein BDR25DRAFT_79416 [Lindgomyces ingoldianus]KAF2466102.1 hypothetical protein BDR25DRAFT_79416 [Lindgomyces ingoldianus]